MNPMTPARLLAGLDAIAATLSTKPQALALLALGSCGLEVSRLDAFSDLDFFVIVEESAKQEFITNLDWLTCGAPLVFAHRNTQDGWKTLDSDGVLCEFAVFHPGELAHIPYAPGRVVWARRGFDVSVLAPSLWPEPIDVEWASVEALTNILVGLKRSLRGEDHAAMRAIVCDAGDQVCRVLRSGAQSDPYNPWRRLEINAPQQAAQMKHVFSQSQVANMARGLILQLATCVNLPPPLLGEIERHLELCDAR